MNVCVIGSGGREHAVVWKLKKSKYVKKIYCIPGNGGISLDAECVPVDEKHILDFVKEKKIDLTIIGPEEPLVSGVVDRFLSEGLKVFGPTKAASILEGSKIFAKNFMSKYRIPTPEYRVFENYIDAVDYVKNLKTGCVVKADGLAKGKGSFVCKTQAEALKAVKDLMFKKLFGESGRRIVVEELLEGKEVTLMCLCSGEKLLPLPPVRDYKRLLDSDKGPNTGGMGSIAPVQIDKKLWSKIQKNIFENFIYGLKNEKIDYTGVIYFGIMIVNSEPYVLEFNVRFGDPEIQALIPVIENDIIELFTATLENKLEGLEIKNRNNSVCVVIASKGYPYKFKKGMLIKGLEKFENKNNACIFHAGTLRKSDRFYVSGGRVIDVVGTGSLLEDARTAAYESIKNINFSNMYYRKDIGC